MENPGKIVIGGKSLSKLSNIKRQTVHSSTDVENFRLRASGVLLSVKVICLTSNIYVLMVPSSIITFAIEKHLKLIESVLLQVIDPINKLIDTVEFDAAFYSLDWHPADHVSFIDNIKQRPIHPTSPVSINMTFITAHSC